MKLLTTLKILPAVRPPAVRLPAPQRVAALLLALLALCLPGRAQAHKNGAPTEGCSGCHHGGKTPTVTITPDLMTVNPGQLLTLTVSISQTNGPVAGFYLEASGVGTLKVVDSGTYLAGNGITHTAPRTGSGGFTTFKVGWTAPATPGGVDFNVWANSANGDGSQNGDAEGDAFFSTAFGCAGTKYYHDYDGDGVGSVTSGYTMACSVPQYYSAKAGDCNDNDPKIYAGAPEICDGKDNNCDGQIDEGLPIMSYCTDADGDGHGVIGKATMMGCAVSKGWGLCDNDCNDDDPTIYPGAPELCNNKDDNCNNQIDEGARTVCGVGWCAKYADGCGTGASQCTPGAPRAEECNDFDDDCDGVKDNGTDLELCKIPGLVCRAGYCIPAGSAGAGSGGVTSGSGAGPSTGDASAGGAPSGPSQPAQAGNTSSGADPSSDPQAAPPGACSVGHSRSRAPFVGLGLLAFAAALLRRKQRRATAARR
jgi:hypothetical protein